MPPNLGNAWHIPDNPEPRGRGGMREPVGAIVPGTEVTICSGNQYQGAGNPGNQLQDGSALSFRRAGDPDWTMRPMLFQSAAGNNKYYAAGLPLEGFVVGDTVEYHLRIAYDDHDTTFLHAGGATGDEGEAWASPFTFALEDPAARGRWSEVFELPNVAVHATLLPTGRVLIWGRRDRPDQSLDVHECTPFVWDPSTRATVDTPQPTLTDGTKVNLFCAGHAFLPDGRLLVAGGHWADGQGLDQAAIYDSEANTWTPTARMTHGRWYPTLTSLPDGRVLCMSGSYLAGGQTPINNQPQIWADGAWTAVAVPSFTFELYPRAHLDSDGSVVLSGPLEKSWTLTADGRWTETATRANASRDYAPSVPYDIDKVIYVGGGSPPTAAAEIIDLGETQPTWRPTHPMNFPRRQHNGTVLPDGTVLVTGGTRGPGFNDIRPGAPVRVAELWDPATGQWTELAAEQVDRCYHSTAVLLPDATVLSAGGGEFRPVDGVDVPNDAQDTHRDAQVFSPPYLFKGPRPTITSAPDSVEHGEEFTVATPDAGDVGMVSLVGLSSVTHAWNMTQCIAFPTFRADGGALRVTAPICTPGHYMLFLLSRDGVPSIASFVRVDAPEPLTPALASVAETDPGELRAAVVAAARGTEVTVGISATCPYGLGACWGGANEALRSLDGVQAVDPVADTDSATARAYLEGERLPPLDCWREQFSRIVGGRYELRGVEVTLDGTVDDDLALQPAGDRPAVQLAPIGAADKIQWDRPAGAPAPLLAEEAAAYDRLTPGTRVTVTGPLRYTDAGPRLLVRRVQA